MAALLKLVNDPRTMSDLPATLNADPWAVATDPQRRQADLRAAVVAPLAELVEGGASINNVAGLFCAQWAAGTLAPARRYAAEAVCAEGISVPTLKRWISAYAAQGRAGLLPQHTGRVRQDYGWELRAAALYNQPSKPGFADVAWRLRGEGHDTATESRVKRYLKSLPATLGPMSPARIGPHLHRLTRQKFQRRSVEELLVGEIYAGDGHTVDAYCGHPNTGKPYRPELTAFIDIKSRYIPGWYFTEAESAVSTLYALSSAMMQFDHVPAWLYIDRGAGYRAKMLSDESTGWYAKFDIEVIGAIPGNPHGKGWIERWFRTVRDKHDKFFDGGQAYCGDDMAPETNRRLSADMAAGRRKLQPFAAYVESFRRFLDEYHNTPMDVLGGRTPAQVWAEINPISVGLEAGAVMRPSQQASVARQAVRLHNRFYFHESLALYDGHKVVVEYDLHADGKVWVHDLKGRLICEARLVNTIGVLPTSRLEEQREKRLEGQLKRLERKADEARSRRADAITADDQVQALNALGAVDDSIALDVPASAPLVLTLPDESPAADGDTGPDSTLDIDILSWKDSQQ